MVDIWCPKVYLNYKFCMENTLYKFFLNVIIVLSCNRGQKIILVRVKVDTVPQMHF